MKTKRKHKEMKDEEELGVYKIISKIYSLSFPQSNRQLQMDS